MTIERTYVKEVQRLIDAGIQATEAAELYQALTIRFENIHGHPETEQFQQHLLSLRKYDLSYFREVIDDACKPVNLNWRSVKFEPTRIKRCETCGNYFYDVSRNGRKITCDAGGIYHRFDKTNRTYRYYWKNGTRLSVCAAEYEKERQASYGFGQPRQPYEILTDFQPGPNDAVGHARLNKVERQAQKVF